MRGKFVFVVGLATGYVLGTRAGRERYVQIKSGADKVWNLPVVQSGVDRVQEFAGARVDTVKANLSKRARKALAGLIGREPLDGPQQSRAAAKAGSTRPKTPVKAASTSTAATTAAKSAAAKPAAAKPAAAKPATSDKPSAGTASPESDD
ncbi:YtxH domain-containing protein [Herbiconiux liangxiaofengii]|uniref:YtxH domain-containing protein n=1 Tax=Herbiconiux liangxiaofengii TaxID=3342795 RepID=UPI0035BB4E9B